MDNVDPFIRTVLRCYHRKKPNDNLEEASLPSPTIGISMIQQTLDINHIENPSYRSSD